MKRTQPEKPDPYVSSDSSPNSNSDRSQPLKLSNNPAVVAFRRLWRRKRTNNDEQLPLLHLANLYVVPHIASPSHMAGESNIAGTNEILVALALQGTSTTASTRASAGADYNLGANGSANANQPFAVTYPENPHDNLRMLEIKSNMDAFGTPPVPPASQMALCGSNTVAM
jgi:hypothetical protein